MFSFIIKIGKIEIKNDKLQAYTLWLCSVMQDFELMAYKLV